MPSLKKILYKKARYFMKKQNYSKDYTQNLIINILAIIVVILSIMYAKNLYTNNNIPKISMYNLAKFSIPNKSLTYLDEICQKYGLDFEEIVTIYCLENQFFPDKYSTPTMSDLEKMIVSNYKRLKKKYSNKKIHSYKKMFEGIFDDLKYFPIPAGYDSEDIGYIYADSYGSPRSYGGDRVHLGTDIVDRENIRARIPIVSMTDGIIENMGWNELGGFRIGVRTENKNYYYYAHFETFAENINKGDSIKAGQILGYMGDTGYDKKEGTKGNFPVHLHLGMLIDTKLSKDEFWINPYAFLRYIEIRKIGI